MKFAVSERFTITSPLSIEEVLARLTNIVGPAERQLFPSFSTWKGKPYKGSVSNNEFQIVRMLNYRNGFLPTITGTLKQRDRGTAIDISMDLDPFVLPFLWFLIVVTSLGTCCIIANSLNSNTFSWTNILPVCLPLWGIAITVIGFQFQAQKSKAFLYSLFEADQPTTEKNN